MRKSLILFILLAITFVLSSCYSRKKYLYFQNLNATRDTIPTAISDTLINSVIIQPYDLLDIKVNTTEKALESLTGSQTSGSGTPGVAGAQSSYISNFLVDIKGNVTLPLAGEVSVKGLTIKQARLKLTEIMKRYLIDPFVEIKFLTFRVTILGEIAIPGTKIISNEKANLIDVIAQSGDLTDFANRTTIKIIRGDIRNPKVYFIDITNTASFNSPGFILQPNDIVYIEPFSKKYLFANINQISPFITIFSSLVTLITLYKLLQ